MKFPRTIISKITGRWSYDSKDNVRYLDELKITPVIKVKKNLSVKNNEYIPRKLLVIPQLDVLKPWEKMYGYRMRWITESAFSSIKRTFGVHVSTVKWNNIVNEMILKVLIYNLFMNNMIA
ncbi:MAG TPA: transposase [Candidatus Nitrosocosmicus sp.]